jgi:hypothetical protein
VRYEALVGNFEGEIRALSDFLELPWDDALLAPASHASAKGFISTPSYSQVVQPVNQKAVGRWRPYEQHLKSIVPQLQPYLDKWGYDA